MGVPEKLFQSPRSLWMELPLRNSVVLSQSDALLTHQVGNARVGRWKWKHPKRSYTWAFNNPLSFSELSTASSWCSPVLYSAGDCARHDLGWWHDLCWNLAGWIWSVAACQIPTLTMTAGLSCCAVNLWGPIWPWVGSWTHTAKCKKDQKGHSALNENLENRGQMSFTVPEQLG